MDSEKRSTFSSKLGFVLAEAGSAVGLGNIWRFPYLAAKYGGGIFLLIYIVLAVTFGYTMIMAETALGLCGFAAGKKLGWLWGVVLGTFIGVGVLKGSPVGPLIGSGMAVAAISLARMLFHF